MAKQAYVCEVLMLLTCGAACVNAWLGNTATTVLSCTTWLICYDNFRRLGDG